MTSICGQRVALPDGEVVRIVRGCYLDCAGAEFAIDISVGDDGNFAVQQREQRLTSGQDDGSVRRQDERPQRYRQASFPAALWPQQAIRFR